jgi:hypothetical protein
VVAETTPLPALLQSAAIITRDVEEAHRGNRPTWAWASRMLGEYPGARYAVEADGPGGRIVVFRRRHAPLAVDGAISVQGDPTVWASVVYALDLAGALLQDGPQQVAVRIGSRQMDGTITPL